MAQMNSASWADVAARRGGVPTGGGVVPGGPSGGGALMDAIKGATGGGSGGAFTNMPAGWSMVNGKPTPGAAPAPSPRPAPQQTASPAGPASSAVLKNSVQMDPNLQWLAGQVRGRIVGDEGGRRAIDVASSKIRDQGEGLQKALDASAASRGIFGSGAHAQQGQELAENVQRAQAGAAADVALGRQRDLDQFMLGATNVFETPARLAQGQQGLALQQYLGERGQDIQKYGIDKNALAQQQAQNWQQQMGLLNLLTSLYS